MWVDPLMRPTSLRVIFIKVNKRRNSELRGRPQVSLRKAPSERLFFLSTFFSYRKSEITETVSKAANQ